MGSSALIGCGNFALGRAQDQPAANPADPAAEKVDLSQRYRFLERYGATDDPTKPDLLIQYRVGIRENIKVTRDNPQGAPGQNNVSTQCIYTERVTKLGKAGTVTETVRHYDKVNTKTSLNILHYKTKPLEGLNILYRLQPPSQPQILCLPPVRQLRQQEYIGVVQEPFLPALASILPRKPSRQGDTWPVPREAARALLGELPTDEDYDLNAEILEIRRRGTGPVVAVIGVKGQVVVREGPSGINAELQFKFQPMEGTPANPGGRVEGANDAKGYISKVSLAQEVTAPLPGNEGRFKQTIRLERVLERRPFGQAGEVATLLEAPTPDPVADSSNSWLMYDDPQGQYHFLHPQKLGVMADYRDGGVDLLDPRHEDPDVIHLALLPKTGDAQRDRAAADPIQVKKKLEDNWKQQGQKVMLGPAGWLPDADWSPLKRKVYRIEAALIPESEQAPPSGRIYSDQYVVHFARDEALMVMGMTTRDPHTQFRDDVESIIKKFELGPSDLAEPPAPTRVPTYSPARPSTTSPARTLVPNPAGGSGPPPTRGPAA
jgi:hypothetical protein